MAGKALELEPGAPNYYLLAVACLKTNDREAALEAIQQAIALSPNNPGYQALLHELQSAP